MKSSTEIDLLAKEGCHISQPKHPLNYFNRCDCEIRDRCLESVSSWDPSTITALPLPILQPPLLPLPSFGKRWYWHSQCLSRQPAPRHSCVLFQNGHKLPPKPPTRNRLRLFLLMLLTS